MKQTHFFLFSNHFRFIQITTKCKRANKLTLHFCIWDMETAANKRLETFCRHRPQQSWCRDSSSICTRSQCLWWHVRACFVAVWSPACISGPWTSCQQARAPKATDAANLSRANCSHSCGVWRRNWAATSHPWTWYSQTQVLWGRWHCWTALRRSSPARPRSPPPQTDSSQSRTPSSWPNLACCLCTTSRCLTRSHSPRWTRTFSHRSMSNSSLPTGRAG